MPERDIESLGVMGKGAGRGQEIPHSYPLTPIPLWGGSMAGARGMPGRDIESLGVMGKGAGGGQEILPPSPPPPSSSPTESECLRITKSFVF